MRKLCQEFLNICNFPVQKNEREISIDANFKQLRKAVKMDIIIPLQSSLTVMLPPKRSSEQMKEKPLSKHIPFPKEIPTIFSFRDEIQVMPSLQKPKKITLLAKDNKEYHFLLKPKDDLRKDSRLMEFNSVVNKLFKKDPEARKRRLRILLSLPPLFVQS